MADTKNKQIDLTDVPAAYVPSRNNVRGNRLLFSNGTRTVFRSGDLLPPTGRRIVGRYSMGGSRDWTVSGSVPGLTVLDNGQLPGPNHHRTVDRGKFILTPGCMPRLHVAAMPSGPVEGETDDSGLVLISGSSGGAVVLSCSFYSPLTGTQQAVDQVVIPTSTNDSGSIFGVENYDPWAHVYRAVSDRIYPSGFTTNADVAAAWSQDVLVEYELQLKNSPRVVDVTIFEEPTGFTFAHDAPVSGTAQALHVYRVAGGVPITHPTDGPQVSAVDGATYDEPRFGTHMSLDVVRKQMQTLGPAVMSWTSAQETSIGAVQHTYDSNGNAGSHVVATDAEVEGLWVSNILPDMLDIANSGSFGWASRKPGWRVSGEYCQRREYNEDEVTLRGRAAVLPVVAHVYAASSAATAVTGTLRFQSSERSYYDMAIPVAGTTYQWLSASFVLEASRTAADPRGLLQVGVGVNGATPLKVRYIKLFADQSRYPNQY